MLWLAATHNPCDIQRPKMSQPMRPRTPVDAIAACIASATQESVDTLSAALERLDALEGVDQPAVRTLALAHVGRCYGTLGDWDAATWYLQQALRWARQLGVPEARIELLCDLAEVCMQRATQPALAAGDAERDAEQARLHGDEALRLVRQAGDADWETRVTSRIGDLLERGGAAADGADGAHASKERPCRAHDGVQLKSAQPPIQDAR